MPETKIVRTLPITRGSPLMFHSALPKLWKHTAAVSMDSQRIGWLLREPDQNEYVKNDHNATEDIRLLITQNQNAI